MSRLAAENFFRKLLSDWWEEMGDAWKVNSTRVLSAWVDVYNPSFWSLLTGPVGLVNRAISATIETIDAGQEYAQDIALVPFRVVGKLLKRDLPLPKELSTRVVKLDDGVKWVLTGFYEAGVAVLDGDLPAHLDIYKRADTFRKVMEASRAFDLSKVFTALKASLISMIILAIFRIIQTGIGLSLILMTGVFVAQIWLKDSRRMMIQKYALPQNNLRERDTKTGRFRIQKHENRHAPRFPNSSHAHKSGN